MQPVDIIAKKRDGKELTRQEIAFAVGEYAGGGMADYQMAALLMAIYLRGMTDGETLALTETMLHSGVVLGLGDLRSRAVDKHSTGGVGDKTSLVIAPVVAACGVYVPMISGRALGHTGGTLDKLESIPGFKTRLAVAEMRGALDRIGAVLAGQTEEIAPADRLIYALRDVTATVGAIPLMAASIMSKKMAEGISGLVLDVKTGSGAFLKTEEQSRRLARTMIDIATGLGEEAVALVTGMDQPLGRMIGNAVEVVEAFETLNGRGPDDLNQLCRELSAEMLVLGRACGDLDAGRLLYDKTIRSGAALEKMQQIIVEQGGDSRVVHDYRLLPRASGEQVVLSGHAGFLQSIDTEAIGKASMHLGAGRLRMDSGIDHAAGIKMEARLGDWLDQSSALAVIYYNDKTKVDKAAETLRQACVIGPEAVQPPNLIRARLT
ncbi:MAG TPA: thymidine phosphorylase [Blastocatellia bacterium]|nr:thymidine phosphorylase [Blastocatellia bacterium]